MIPSPKSATPVEKIVIHRIAAFDGTSAEIRRVRFLHLVNGTVINHFPESTSRDWIAGFAAGRGATIEEEEVSS